MKYSEPFTISIPITTEHGNRFLVYTNQSESKKGKIRGGKVRYGLGADSTDGTWHTFKRDLEADWNAFMPNDPFVAVNGFFIKGSGYIDDIESSGYKAPNSDNNETTPVEEEGRAGISHLDAVPKLYIPTVPVNNPNALCKISFDLNASSDVEMIISNVDVNQTVFQKMFSSLPKGKNTLTWNGKNMDNNYVLVGRYKVDIRAVDSNGSQSDTAYTFQQIFY